VAGHLERANQGIGRRLHDSTGPFWCTAPRAMVLSRFDIAVSCPTSTSTDLDVVINYANAEGMILELRKGGNPGAESLKSFDCGWISRFAEEGEHLLFSGQCTIKVDSIRLMASNRYFGGALEAICIFDRMFRGLNMKTTSMGTITGRNEVVAILRALIGADSAEHSDTVTEDNGDSNKQIAYYLKETFHLFCEQKREIEIRMDHLNSSWLRGMRELIFENVECVTMTVLNASESAFFESYTNLLDWRVFEIFTNLEMVRMYTTNLSGYKCYPFSLLFFAEIIKSGHRWKRIEIVAARDKGGAEHSTDSWMASIWKAHHEVIAARFKQNKFEIAFQAKSSQNSFCNDEDHIVVTRAH